MKIGLVLDSIEKINLKKDSSIAIAKSALNYSHSCFYLEFNSLSARTDGKKSDCFVNAAEFKQINLAGEKTTFELSQFKTSKLSQFDVILMRKDPPFNNAYLYATYILSLAEKNYGCLVINKPSALRDFNEKFFITHFTDIAPKTIITQSESEIRFFLNKEKKAVIKPLDAMGGESIFILKNNDLNLTTILETMLSKYSFVILQEYLDAIEDGDKRVLMIDGEVFDYGVKRLPKAGDFRGNTARGASSEGYKLTQSQKLMCQKLSLEMKKLGILLTGIDLIGDKITEINITSPTCFREYQEIFDIDVGSALISAIEKKIKTDNPSLLT